MKRVLLAILVMFGSLAVVATFSSGCAPAGQTQAVKYHCPMHPTVVSDKPGRCPICGMDLTQVQPAPAPEAKEQPAKAKALKYHCPMHPTVVSDKPGLPDLRHEAGADGERANGSSGEKDHVPSTMNPNEVSDKPGKDSMGMDMVPFEVTTRRRADARRAGGRVHHAGGARAHGPDPRNRGETQARPRNPHFGAHRRRTRRGCTM